MPVPHSTHRFPCVAPTGQASTTNFSSKLAMVLMTARHHQVDLDLGFVAPENFKRTHLFRVLLDTWWAGVIVASEAPDRGERSTTPRMLRPSTLYRPTSRSMQSVRRAMSSGQNHESRQSTRNPFTWYSRQLDDHPLLTNCVSGGLIMFIGDTAVQYYSYAEEDQNDFFFLKKWDTERTVAFTMVQALILSPARSHWYRHLAHDFWKIPHSYCRLWVRCVQHPIPLPPAWP